MTISYKDAGVDVTAGYRAVDLMKKSVRQTFDANVIGDIGGFGGLYSLESINLAKPVLVSGTDGVGTKLKYAFALEKYDTVGIDCVAMCVNDVVCQGAKPLFFLDYLATGKLIPEMIAEIVSGVAEGCTQAGCALIGGETAEMPGFYADGEFDMAGFTTGIVDRDKLISGETIVAGDVLVGLASSGAHSNGYSLIRKLFDPSDKKLLSEYSPALGDTIGMSLLKPTRIYVKSALALIEKFRVKGTAHITGGGFIENIPRMIPNNLGVAIDTNAINTPELFKMLVKMAGLTKEQAYNTFNMGIGIVFAIDRCDVDKFVEYATQIGEIPTVIGSVVSKTGISI
ncbi:MAG: phosphoribosylformylglycinamidine cyclo-ligase [Christensenellaceae bacterium]|jgi:phosphoribosylformylglycinamidine cyclo-ligase|nr:phosphoribosylformylglycinamidine cyclo-ligase [Christensenellaceae bacterium]